jgi:hypothetical protein
MTHIRSNQKLSGPPYIIKDYGMFQSSALLLGKSQPLVQVQNTIVTTLNVESFFFKSTATQLQGRRSTN